MKKSENRNSKIEDWGQAQARLAEYEAAQIEIDKAEGARKEALYHAEEAYAKMAAKAQLQQFQLAQALKKFAQAHKGDFKAVADGGEGRTRTLGQVTIGFEWGKPYVKVATRKVESAIAWLKEFGEDTYVRFKPEIARDRLRDMLTEAKEKHNQEAIDRFAGQGITLEQDEDFVLKVE